MHAIAVGGYRDPTARVESRALRWNDKKLIYRDLEGEISWELYDLASDPGEQNDLSAERPEALALFQERLAEEISGDESFRTSRGFEAGQGEYGDSTVEQLRALGYLE